MLFVVGDARRLNIFSTAFVTFKYKSDAVYAKTKHSFDDVQIFGIVDDFWKSRYIESQNADPIQSGMQKVNDYDTFMPHALGQPAPSPAVSFLFFVRSAYSNVCMISRVTTTYLILLDLLFMSKARSSERLQTANLLGLVLCEYFMLLACEQC